MCESDFPLPEIARMLLTDASAVLKEYGAPFLEESMYIVI
jgi:hypothetical protein